jgi:nucleoside-diphosphate-sugar epimerase
MKILVFGATGFIGPFVLQALAPRHEVFAITRSAPPNDSRHVKWLQGDLLQSDLGTLLPDTVDAVLFLAQSREYRSFPERVHEIFDVNVQGMLIALEYARHFGVRQFIYTSSANVYRQSDAPISESAPLESTSFYAQSKRMAEMLLESYAGYFSCRVLRLFTVYGPGQRNMLIPNLIARVQNACPIEVQGRNGLLLSPIFAMDLSCIIRSLIERESPEPGYDILNIGGEEHLSIHNLALAIGVALNRTPCFKFRPGPEAAGWLADISKVKILLALDPLTSFDEGIARTICGESNA